MEKSSPDCSKFSGGVFAGSFSCLVAARKIFSSSEMILFSKARILNDKLEIVFSRESSLSRTGCGSEAPRKKKDGNRQKIRSVSVFFMIA